MGKGGAMSLPLLLEHTKQANAALREASNKSMDLAKQCAASRKAAMAAENGFKYALDGYQIADNIRRLKT